MWSIPMVYMWEKFTSDVDLRRVFAFQTYENVVMRNTAGAEKFLVIAKFGLQATLIYECLLTRIWITVSAFRPRLGWVQL